jgi:hypothetical protein
MTIKAACNLYTGINPHLNSLLQTPGTQDHVSLWEGFHSSHIGHIGDSLNEKLPSSYYAVSEQSLQIRIEDWQTGFSREQRRRPDVSIYGAASGDFSSSTVASVESFALDLIDTLVEDELYFTSIVIREQQSGDLVTRIELLSPANKPGYAAYFAYRQKRLETMSTGIPLVEIDFLHETLPVIESVPQYLIDANAFPYNAYVNDPRPSVKAGRLRVYGAQVGSKLPIVTIPLIGAESTALDLDAVYQHTFKVGRWGTRDYMDYSLQPARFHTYSPADQARILSHMGAIATAAANGVDLETWDGSTSG